MLATHSVHFPFEDVSVRREPRLAFPGTLRRWPLLSGLVELSPKPWKPWRPAHPDPQQNVGFGGGNPDG
jgi:hypothetical protein